MIPGEPIEAITFNDRGFPPMRRTYVREDLHRVQQDKAHLYFWQEFWFPRYRHALRAQLANNYEHYAPSGIEGTCISYRLDRLKLQFHFSRPLHGAVPFVCAKRAVRGGVFTDLAGGPDITALSAHLSPWAKGKGEAAQDEGFAMLQRFIAHHIKMGRRVVVGIDANSQHDRVMEKLGKEIAGAEVKVISHDIDHLIFVGDWHIESSQVYKDGLVHSDHNPLKAVAS